MKHFLFLISLYLFATSVVRGQSEKPDSLFRLLREGIVDTQQFFVNKEIGNFYQYQNGSRALFYYEKALKLAKLLKRPLEEANTHYSLGYSFRLQGEYDKALQAYLEAVRLYDALNDDRRLVNTWLSMISVYAETKKYKQAHDCVSKARELISRSQDSSQLSELYSQSGNIYFAEQKPELALSELSKGLEVAQNNNDDYGILTCLANIGLMHKQLGNPVRPYVTSKRLYKRIMMVRQMPKVIVIFIIIWEPLMPPPVNIRMQKKCLTQAFIMRFVLEPAHWNTKIIGIWPICMAPWEITKKNHTT